MKGKKKTPDALKVLKGTDQPCRMNKDQPKYEVIIKAPSAPKWFTPLGKRIYRDTTRQLIATGVLQSVDMQMLIAYCNVYALHLQIEQELNVSLSGRLQTIEGKHGEHKDIAPLQRISDMALKRAQSIAAEYGLTPSSRTRVSVKSGITEDPFELFLNEIKLLKGRSQ